MRSTDFKSPTGARSGSLALQRGCISLGLPSQDIVLEVTQHPPSGLGSQPGWPKLVSVVVASTSDQCPHCGDREAAGLPSPGQWGW